MKHLLFVAATLLILPQAAAAKPVTVQKAETVAIGDLDLTSANGQRVLHQRISAAVGRACAPDQDIEPAPPLPDSRCFSRTMKGARSQMQLAIAKAERKQQLASTLDIKVR